MTFTAVPVPKDKALAAWWKILDWVVQACERGDGSWTSLEAQRQVAIGNCGLWLIVDQSGGLHGFALSATEKWPDGSIVGVVVMAGGRGGAHWHSLISNLERWAAAWGADRMIVRGRKGWLRWLKDYRLVEWEPRCCTMEKRFGREKQEHANDNARTRSVGCSDARA